MILFKDIKLKKLANYKKIRLTNEATLEDKILKGKYKPVKQIIKQVPERKISKHKLPVAKIFGELP